VCILAPEKRNGSTLWAEDWLSIYERPKRFEVWLKLRLRMGGGEAEGGET